MAKVLANRLKKGLPFIIDERQSAFIEGRHLLHSVVIANEVVHEAKRAQKSCMVFKVDYEKAYDSVSWNFLFYMLQRMGFCSNGQRAASNMHSFRYWRMVAPRLSSSHKGDLGTSSIQHCCRRFKQASQRSYGGKPV